MKHSIAPYKYPRRIEFVNSLPKTTSGKIKRRELRELERARAADNVDNRGPELGADSKTKP